MTQILFVSLLLPGSWVFGQTNAKEFTPPDESPALTARMEVTAHEQSFTVRFFIKNQGNQDAEVVFGRGGMGMSVVPQFHLGELTITPPTYLRPGRRAMAPDKKKIPAGKEVLYGTFTMGYPWEAQQGMRPDRTPMGEKISATIRFAQPKITLDAEAPWPKKPEKK